MVMLSDLSIFELLSLIIVIIMAVIVGVELGRLYESRQELKDSIEPAWIPVNTVIPQGKRGRARKK